MAEGFGGLAECLGDGRPQPIGGGLVEMQAQAGSEAQPAAHQHERDVVVGVAVAFAQFVGPQDRGVVEQGTCLLYHSDAADDLTPVTPCSGGPFYNTKHRLIVRLTHSHTSDNTILEQTEVPLVVQ